MNHLWQSSAFAILAALLAFWLRRSPAKVRYWVWLTASLKFLVPMTLLVSFGTLLPHPAPRVVPVTPVILKIAEPFAPVVYSPAPAQNEVNWLAILWALGFLAVVVARCRSWLRIQSALRAASPVELPIPIRAVVAQHATEPGVVGLFRPVLVLPPKLLDHLNAQQLSAVLAHEMCHVRRRDNFFAAVHMLVEAIFWFNPLVWWIGSRLVEERERACDEEVLRTGCEPADYVEGILQVCRLYRESPLPYVSGVTGADVKKRLRTILSGTIARDWTAKQKVSLATAGLAILATPIAIGILNAAPAPTKFEVASIRPCQPGQGPLGFRVTPGNLRVVCMNVQALMVTAYMVYGEPDAGVFARNAISGGPSWSSSDAWDIEAKAEGDPNGAVMGGPMLRQLLEDRFKLKLHRDTKKIPVYELAVAKSGLKLKPLDKGSCTPVDLLTPGPVPPDQRCNWQGYNPRGIDIHAANLDQLADLLSHIGAIDRPVINRIKIAGMFDVRLEFSRDGPRMTFTGSTDAPRVTSEGPSIFTALEEQLGLKLVPAKADGAFLVIDHVERPTEN